MSKRTGLAELDLLPAYRSGRNSLISEFYVPCLSVCTRYDRAVGFFTSTSLSVAAKGLSRLIGNGGTMRLIASPSLSEEDAAAIKEGYRKREQIFERALLRELDEHRVIDNITKKRVWKGRICARDIVPDRVQPVHVDRALGSSQFIRTTGRPQFIAETGFQQQFRGQHRHVERSHRLLNENSRR